MTEEQNAIWQDDVDLMDALEQDRPPDLQRKQRMAHNAMRKAMKHTWEAVAMDIRYGTDHLYDGEKEALIEEAVEEMNALFGALLIMSQAGFPYYKAQRKKTGSESEEDETDAPEHSGKDAT